MRKRKNPFPGVTRVTDRHGKVRWRYRRKTHSCYLHGDYGSVEFRKAYENAVAGIANEKKLRAEPGTMNWLCEQYLMSIKYGNLADSSKKVLRGELDWLMKAVGGLPFKSFEKRHIEAVMKRKEGPAAANKVKKNCSRLFNFAIDEGFGLEINPARRAVKRKENSLGFYTWSDEDIAVFRRKHSSGTKPRLALELALNTGAARQDLVRLGWGNVKNSTISYARGKTTVATTLPILPDLQKELDLVSRDQFLFLTHSGGRAYKAESYGNWFKARTVEAGLNIPSANSHGLRKAGATRLAEHGATEWEIASYLAHSDTSQAAEYVVTANRAKMAASGMAKLSSTEN
ncbi:site-specific integrase [Octadecabacter sp. B2R22]|nr:tyrosine-type recombinase/integrase [Octadecabacter sp. B2R22]MBU2993941.1 site-specific integrase [Octadecabacter sp. B2R22]